MQCKAHPGTDADEPGRRGGAEERRDTGALTAKEPLKEVCMQRAATQQRILLGLLGQHQPTAVPWCNEGMLACESVLACLDSHAGRLDAEAAQVRVAALP